MSGDRPFGSPEPDEEPAGREPHDPYQSYGYGVPAPPQPGVVPLAPLDLGRLLSAAFATWRRDWRLLLGIGAVAALIGTLIGILNTRARSALAPPGIDRPQEPGAGFLELGANFLASGVNTLVYAVLSGVVGGLVAVVARSAVLGRPMSGSEAWAATRPRLPALIGLCVVINVVVLLGLMLCLVPGLIVFTLWSLAVPAMVIERQRVSESLTRSYRLVVGDGWRVFGILALVFLAAGFVSAVIGLPLTAPSGIPQEPAAALGWDETLLAALGQFVGQALTITAVPLAAFFLYVDQRIRRERYDLQLAYEAQHPGEPPSPSVP